MAKTKLLLIEDDRSLSDVLVYNFQGAGYEVLIARDGQDGLLKAQTKSPDVVILDLMLPVIDGLDVCRRLRAQNATKDVSILMLTAKSEESDELVGFALGADDYVTKPFSVRVLLERVKALVRRTSRQTEPDDITVLHGVSVDRRRHEVLVDSEHIPLTPSEFRLLDQLIQHPDRVFDRAQLLDAALADSMAEERTIDVHIRGLRRKLGNRAEVIQTVRGIGYRFADVRLAANLD